MTWWLPVVLAAVALVAYVVGSATAQRQRRRTTDDLEAELARVTEQRDELQQQQEELERVALRDEVTGLGNRRFLRDRGAELGPQLADASLLLLGLDRFKEINDSMGQSAGDALLRQVTSRLLECVRTNDLVTRLSGDEFALLLPDAGDWTAARTADRVLDVVRRPFDLNGRSVQARGRIGIAHGYANVRLEELLRNADLAMSQAKAAGSDRACEFDEVMAADTTQQFSRDVEMRAALTNGDFKVYYQPLVDARDHRVVSLEALIRWEHPQRGVLPPSEFLAATERNGMIVDLGRFVLHTACQHTAGWRRKLPWLTVAVNVSERELFDPDFTAQVAGVLAATGLPPEALVLEVTETVLAAEDQITEILSPLTGMGVQCALDDFGTGHSSLSRLRHLAVDEVKIDRSFVMEISQDGAPDSPFVAAIIGLAHSLGLRVVAEGIETTVQADFLRDQGCDELQGYLFSKPVPAAKIPAILRADRAQQPPAAV
ncbi:bifunctional diguanylate cyclase/phosphodiesterase [Nocardioides sp.]|uniref:putative bifunctional diguanylate cyclase/phosphodiesterase n=1 Tax=Nocardioides sp. TaxID=35761 RepID=UPI001A30FDB2|nr:bifunctional diguanylate cyclase/phosphodiesterase [Nocardioides sp.]MBJ7359755.1 bifunctional diguanylate cyclase/phosphodiesterase [Nocardioides sp.]